MDPVQSRERLGQVFDGVAAAYDQARPGYPAGLVDAAFARMPSSPGAPILEVGCGTGKLTEALVVRDVVVDAVDPGPNMIAAARARVGPRDNIRFHIGRFEDVDLPGDAYTGLFSATAFHWVDPRIGWRKAASHLVRGGLIALLTHIAVRDEQTAASEDGFRALLATYAPEAAYGLPRAREPEAVLAGVEERRSNASEVWDWIMSDRALAVEEGAELFEDVEVSTEIISTELTSDEVVAHFATTSLYFQIDPARRQAFLDDDRRLIEREGGRVMFTHAAVLMTARRS